MKRLVRQLKTRLAPLLAVAVAFMLLFTMSAGVKAAPGDDIATKTQQAGQVSQEINALDQQFEISTEAYDRVKSELDAITMKVDDTRVKLSEIRQDLNSRRELLDKRVTEMYMDGRTSLLEVLLRARDFSDFLDETDYVARVEQNDSDLIERVTSNRDSVEQVEQELSDQQRQQQGLVDQTAAQKADIETQLQERQQVLTGLNQDIQNLLAQQQQTDIAGEQVLDQQAESAFANTEGNLPDDLAKAALQFLGVPYEWGASGPSAFDCSGLTMYVYNEFGIDLPHNAAMQYNLGTKISLDQAQPGDLVFFGMPPHHVGMYLGNDMFIEAPHTGDVVKVSKLSSMSDFSGVCRY